MKKDRFHNFDNEVRDLVLDFGNTVLKGKTQFFDVDEMEIIIDYYFEVNDPKPLERAVQYAEQLYPDSTSIRLRRAHLMISKEQYGEALQVISKMAERIPGNDGSDAAVKDNASQKLQRFIALNHTAKES